MEQSQDTNIQSAPVLNEEVATLLNSISAKIVGTGDQDATLRSVIGAIVAHLGANLDEDEEANNLMPTANELDAIDNDPESVSAGITFASMRPLPSPKILKRILDGFPGGDIAEFTQFLDRNSAHFKSVYEV